MRNISIGAAAALVLASCGTVLAAVQPPVATPAEPAAAPLPLASFRASYEVSLAGAEPQSLVTAALGRIAMEVVGSDCAGWSTRITNSTLFNFSESVARVLGSRNTGFELGDTLTFQSEDTINDQVSAHADGVAVRQPDGTLRLTMTEPIEGEVTVERPALFPSAHMEAIIAAMDSGESDFRLYLYDGSGDGLAAIPTDIAIDPPGATVAETPEIQEIVAAAGMADMRHWQMRMTYFQDFRGDEVAYLINDTVTYENGISTIIEFDLGGIHLEGRLTALELFDEPACPAV